jgi:hypothetical protein
MPLPGLAVFLVLLFWSIGFGATKDSPPPDREMLKMMDLLREMEMIKQIDMLQDMQHLENSEQVKNAAPQKAAPGKKKETPK